MVFIDGTWLYQNTPRLRKLIGEEDYRIDFGKLPQFLARQLGERSGIRDVDIVRTYFFASYPTNYAPEDSALVEGQKDFYNMLKEEYHYEVEAFPLDFRGRRVRAADRDPDDLWHPREKQVDVALATTMLFYAALPHAYDIAVAVLGDEDYIPVLQAVRRLGKRVIIASIQGSCDAKYLDPNDPMRVRDLDTILLNEHLDELRLEYTEHLEECQSPHHVGERRVLTTFRPRTGQKFYCPACRSREAEERQRAYRAIADLECCVKPGYEPGVVTKVVRDKGYGFVQGGSGAYFFHYTHLQGISWEAVEEGLRVQFLVDEPPQDRAGKAKVVEPIAEQAE